MIISLNRAFRMNRKLSQHTVKQKSRSILNGSFGYPINHKNPPHPSSDFLTFAALQNHL